MNKPRKKLFLIRVLQSIALPVVVYVFFFALSKGRFGQPNTMLIILRQSIFPILLAYGITANMQMQMLDFSGGAVVFCAAIIGGNIAVTYNLNVIGLIILSVLIGMLFTTITGIIYNMLKIPSLVLTIGLCMFYEAIALGVFGGEVFVGRTFSSISKNQYSFIVFAVAFAVMYIIFNKTVFGRNIRFIGINQNVAKSTGINIKWAKLKSFTLGGAFIGLSSVFMLTNNSIVSAPSTLGSLTIIFDAIMGVFIGIFLSKYCNLIIGVAIGAFTMKMLSVALIAVGLTGSVRDVFTGFFLLVILSISANQDLPRIIRERKAAAKAANEEYSIKTLQNRSN